MTENNSLRTTLLILAILAATLAAGWPVLKNDFINFGDDKYVTENHMIRSLSLENLREMFSSRSVNQYNPLVVLSFAVEYSLGGLNPAIFHATNLILHVLNSVLLFFLIRKILPDDRLAFICGILFGVHPLHVESYAWVSERKDVLSTFFLILSTFEYLKYIKSRLNKDFALAVLWFILGILSKPIVVLFPLFALLIDWYMQRKEPCRKLFREKAVFFLISVTFALVSFYGEKLHAKAMVLPFSWWQNVAMGFNNLCWYLYKSLVPSSLSAFYPYPSVDSITPLHSLLATAGFACMIFVLWRIRNQRNLFFGFTFFLMFLFPYLKIFPFGAQFMRGDRYFYVSSIGLFFAFFSWLLAIIDAKAASSRWLTCFWVVFSIFTAVFTFQSHVRCQDWKNSGTLWLSAIEKGYHSHLAYLSLGDYLARRGAVNKAIECFQNAIVLKPNDADAMNNLGISLVWIGNPDQGISFIQQALQIRPEFSNAWLNLGVALLHAGKQKEALTAFEKAIHHDPRNPEAHFRLGQELMLCGKSEDGKNHFRQAKRLGFSKFPADFYQRYPDL